MKYFLLTLTLAASLASSASADEINRTCAIEDIPNGTKSICVYVVPMPSLTLTVTTTCTVTMADGKYASACNVDTKVKTPAPPAVAS